MATLLVTSTLEAAQENPWIALAVDQARKDAGPGLISGVIDYGASFSVS